MPGHGHEGQGIPFAIGAKILPESGSALLRRVRGQDLEIGLAGRITVLDGSKPFIVEFWRDRGEDALDRPAALHVGMVVVLSRQRKEIKKTVGDGLERTGEIREARGRLPEDAGLVASIAEDRALPSELPDQGFCKGPHGWIPPRHRGNRGA